MNRNRDRSKPLVIKYYKHNFFPSTVRHWNSLSTSVVRAPSLVSFKRELSNLTFIFRIQVRNPILECYFDHSVSKFLMISLCNMLAGTMCVLVPTRKLDETGKRVDMHLTKLFFFSSFALILLNLTTTSLLCDKPGSQHIGLMKVR